MKTYMLSIEQLYIHSFFAKILTEKLVLIVILLGDGNTRLNKTINKRAKIISILDEVAKIPR